MPSLFISYSRKDTDCARRLTEAFKGQDLDFWIDWESIPPTVDWWSEVERGIEQAGVFLFLVSPDSIRSRVCRQEIDHALKNGKRLIPVVVRDVNANDTPTVLSHLNWIFIRENDDFNTAFDKLINAIKTDYDWVRVHRDLQGKALEWDRSIRKDGSKRDASFLLRGTELQLAEFQVQTNASKDPRLTELQKQYLRESRQEVDRQSRILTITGIVAGIVVVVLGAYGWIKAGEANNSRATAELNLATAKTAEAFAETQNSLAIDNANTAEAAKADAVAKKVLADSNAKIARAEKLAALAIPKRAGQFDLSLLLAVEAFHTSDIFSTKSVLLDSAQTNPQLIQYIQGSRDRVYTAAVSPDGKTLATKNWDGTITLWEVVNGNLKSRPIGGYQISSLAFSPDGTILAAGSWDGTVTLWNVATGKQDGQVPTENNAGITSLAFSLDGKTLAAGNGNNAIILWDLETRNPKKPLITGSEKGISSLAFSPDGKTLASGSCGKKDANDFVCIDGVIDLWDLESRTSKGQSLFTQSGNVLSISFSPDGKKLAAGGCAKIGYPNMCLEGQINLWTMENAESDPQILKGHSGGVTDVHLLQDGNTLISGSEDRSVILWNVAGQPPLSKILEKTENSSGSIAFSPDGKTSAIGALDGSIILLDSAIGREIDRLCQKQCTEVTNLEFSPDGKTLASKSKDGNISLWDVISRQPIGQFPRKTGGFIWNGAFSPDNITLAVGIADQEVLLWDFKNDTYKPLWLGECAKKVTRLAFSPDGKTLALGNWDGSVSLWNTTEGKCSIPPVKVHTEAVMNLLFSPDGKTLASSSINAEGISDPVILWEVADGRLKPFSLVGHTDQVPGLTFSTDSSILASGGTPDTIILWDVANHQPIGEPLVGNGIPILSVAFSPEGKTLTSGNREGTIILWAMDPQSWVEIACKRAGRNLTHAEWALYFPNEEKYRATCPQWPLEPDPAVTPSPTP